MLVQAERPKLVLEMARLLLAEVPNLVLVLESQEPGQAARLVQAEPQAEPRPEQEQQPEQEQPPEQEPQHEQQQPGQEKPSGQACTEMPIS